MPGGPNWRDDVRERSAAIEALDLAVGLIQEAKRAGPNDHLDAAERHLSEVRTFINTPDGVTGMATGTAG